MRIFIKVLASTLLIIISFQPMQAQGNVPPPGGAVPSPGGAIPPSRGAVPPAGGATPQPGSGVPTPGNQGGGNISLGAMNPTGGGLQIPNPGTLSQNPGTFGQAGRATLPAQATFGSINQNAWYANPYVQAQLNLNAQQANQLNQLYSQYYGSYSQQQAQFNGTSSLTDEQRMLQLQAINRFHNDLIASTNNIIDANQRARLNQLSLQYRGYQAFNDPAVAQRLQLNNDQLTRLRSYEQMYDQQLANTYRFRSVDPNVLPTRIGELRNDMFSRINTVLTPEQQRIWKELVGDPYNFRVE